MWMSPQIELDAAMPSCFLKKQCILKYTIEWRRPWRLKALTPLHWCVYHIVAAMCLLTINVVVIYSGSLQLRKKGHEQVMVSCSPCVHKPLGGGGRIQYKYLCDMSSLRQWPSSHSTTETHDIWWRWSTVASLFGLGSVSPHRDPGCSRVFADFRVGGGGSRNLLAPAYFIILHPSKIW